MDEKLSRLLFEGETVCFEIPSAAILVYWKSWIPTFSLAFQKKMAVTNKRVILTYSWFGVQSYRGAYSYFYNKLDYELYRRRASWLIGKYTVGKLRPFGEYIKITPAKGFIKPKTVIFSKYSPRIAELISQANL